MTRQSRVASARPRRAPLAYRNRLTIKNKEPGYRYRVVNDVDDRVLLMQERGYELVPADEVAVGDKRVDTATPLGSVKTLSVGQGTKAVVMRIPEEFAKEDDGYKASLADDLEQTMKGDARKAADFGNLNISVNSKE